MGSRNPFLYSKLSLFECTVQYCTVQYKKVQFFTKLFNMVMLYVFSMVFEVKKLISELKMTLMFMYCTVLYNFVPYCTVKYSSFLKLFNMGMLYVVSMVFKVKKLISTLKMTLMFMYCTVLHNFVP